MCDDSTYLTLVSDHHTQTPFLPHPLLNLTLYAYCVFPEHNSGHLSQNRGGRLNQVEARSLGGNFNLPFLDHQLQLHQILEERQKVEVRQLHGECAL